MADKTVTVSVVNNDFVVGDVTMDTGNNQLKFKREENGTWRFTNISIWVKGTTQPSEGSVCAPFDGDTTHTSPDIKDQKITIYDQNPVTPDHTDKHYSFCLYGKAADNTPINHDPEIINKGM